MLTAQALGVGLPMVKYSRKLLPTRPSAKYQALLTGPTCSGVDVDVAFGLAACAWCVLLMRSHPNRTLPAMAAIANPRRTTMLMMRDDCFVPQKRSFIENLHLLPQ